MAWLLSNSPRRRPGSRISIVLSGCALLSCAPRPARDASPIEAGGPWGTTPLHSLLDRGGRNIARILIEHGADVNAKDATGLTPFRMLVAKENQFYEETLELMRRHGARE